MSPKRLPLCLIMSTTLLIFSYCDLCANTFVPIWNIGINDNSSSELALGDGSYKRFIFNDFGFEDTYYLVGFSQASKNFPATLPGPSDTWGGTWGTSGWRTHDINILFGVNKLPDEGEWKLIIDLADNSVSDPPTVKVSVNGFSRNYIVPTGGNDKSIDGETSSRKPYTITLDIPAGVIRTGGNMVNINTIFGSWVIFDDVRLEGTAGVVIEKPADAFVRTVEAADYQISDSQPLLVDVEHLKGNPLLSVELDGKQIFSHKLDSARYIFEAPMPKVESDKTSRYSVLINGREVRSGLVVRSPQREQTLADYVDTRIGTAHSRWMIAPGPWMPFSMVKISPDNQNKGWQAGYQYNFESIGCFSHIHEWTMGGLGVMATNGPLITVVGDQADPDSGYRSRVDRTKEHASIGSYSIILEDYGINAEVTSTTRCSFQRYTFPKDKNEARILIDLHTPAEYDYSIKQMMIRKVSDTRIEGFCDTFTPDVWFKGTNQEFKLHFVIEFDKPIARFGGWIDDNIILQNNDFQAKNVHDGGAWVEFNHKDANVVQTRVGISLVSIANAAENLREEITKPFGWSFDEIKDSHIKTWNELFGRVKITTADRNEKVRFYNSMYRSLCERNIWSDVNGEWIAADNSKQKFANSDNVALGCDAFWNTFWNLNQFWNLVTPEWSNRWVNSQLAMYDAGGWLAKGPAGMKYIPVMVAEHEIPLIVGAYQMGIRDFDVKKAFEACRKMATTQGQKVPGGYAGYRDLTPYLEHGYVPMDKGRYSNTMEYSYDMWTIGQFAKSLGIKEDYKLFDERGGWWRNAMNKKNGFCHLRTSDGKWVEPFDPMGSNADKQYVEANAWQMSFFVPQDVPALADYVGEEKFINRLDSGFVTSYPVRFNAPNDQYWNHCVVQGNQQTMHMPFMFNWVGRPWLTQKWSRAIIERYYNTGKANAYLGDEDQGQMSAWLVMASIGLFQTDGGCSEEPVYEIASPLYQKVEIDLGERYGRGKSFTIEAQNASRNNKYVQSATLNGKRLNSFQFPASELLKGGSLILKMGSEPNKSWGVK